MAIPAENIGNFAAEPWRGSLDGMSRDELLGVRSRLSEHRGALALQIHNLSAEYYSTYDPNVASRVAELIVQHDSTHETFIELNQRIKRTWR